MKLHVIDTFDELSFNAGKSPYAVYSALESGSLFGVSDMISVKMVLSGEELYRIGHRNFKLQQGQFLLTPAKAEVQGMISNRAEGLCLFFPAELVAEARQSLEQVVEGELYDSTEDFHPIEFNTKTTSLGQLIQSMSFEQLAGEESEQIIVESLAGHFNYLAQIDNKLREIKCSTRNELLRRLERAKSFLMSNLCEQIQLVDVAQIANLSKFHLNRLFRQVYGTPPLRFHQNCRLDWAKAQLSAGQTTSQVAELLDFSSVTSFSRAFARRHGVRPSFLNK